MFKLIQLLSSLFISEPDSTVNLMCLTSGGFLLVFTNIRLLNGGKFICWVNILIECTFINAQPFYKNKT